MTRAAIRLSLNVLAVAIALVGAGVGARAEPGAGLSGMRVLPGWRMADGTHMTALEVRLEPGWKTYWRVPGEAGIPPQFDWRRSRNLTGVEILWPTPSVSTLSGLKSIGYSEVLILPLRVLPSRAGGDVVLKGRIEIGVCREVCIPVEQTVSARLPAGPDSPDPRIAAALADRPDTASEAGVGRVACRLSPVEGGLGLRAEIDMPGAASFDTAVVEVANPDIWVAPPKVGHSGNRLIAESRLYHADGRSFALDRSGVRITVLGRGRAVDIQGCTAG